MRAIWSCIFASCLALFSAAPSFAAPAPLPPALSGATAFPEEAPVRGLFIEARLTMRTFDSAREMVVQACRAAGRPLIGALLLRDQQQRIWFYSTAAETAVFFESASDEIDPERCVAERVIRRAVTRSDRPDDASARPEDGLRGAFLRLETLPPCETRRRGRQPPRYGTYSCVRTRIAGVQAQCTALLDMFISNERCVATAPQVIRGLRLRDVLQDDTTAGTSFEVTSIMIDAEIGPVVFDANAAWATP
jgi:hypothetical protein